MRKIRVFNTLFLVSILLVFPVYPVFGDIFYNITGGIRDFIVDESLIIAMEDGDKNNEWFMSVDIPIDTSHDWSWRQTIENYTVQSDDVLGQLAQDFGLTKETISINNRLESERLPVGKVLLIPPGDGYIHTVSEWDTFESIARKYHFSVEKIQDANLQVFEPLEIKEMIFIPGYIPTSFERDWVFMPKVINPDGKWFVPGHCTYFVAQHWDVQWRGHAKDWFRNAQKSGFKTGQTPTPGAIAVWYGPGYNLAYGHVGLVLSVDRTAGTMVIKDMNYAGLWKITTRTEKIKNPYLLGFIYNEKL